MEKRVLYQVCMSTLILLLFTWNLAQGTPETTDDIFRSFNTNLMLAKNGQKFGYLQSSILYYSFQWVFVFTIDREVGKDIRISNFKIWLKNIKQNEKLNSPTPIWQAFVTLPVFLPLWKQLNTNSSTPLARAFA